MLADRVAALDSLRHHAQQEPLRRSACKGGGEVLELRRGDAAAPTSLRLFVWPGLVYLLYSYPTPRGAQFLQYDFAIGDSMAHLRAGSIDWTQCADADEALPLIDAAIARLLGPLAIS